MKATIPLKLYVNEEQEQEIRRKCAAAGKSISRAGVEALLHWQPNRTVRSAHRHRPIHGYALGLPGRACLRL